MVKIRSSRGAVPAVCLGLAMLLISCDQKPSAPVKETNDVASTESAPVEQTSASPDFLKLKGKWLRPDGGYVLEIREVDAKGTMQAGYLNPGPIHVSKALAIQEGSVTKVFVELRDEGYPGCTYSLKYDAATDQLFGEYFQAGLQETYDVTFERLKQE